MEKVYSIILQFSFNRSLKNTSWDKWIFDINIAVYSCTRISTMSHGTVAKWQWGREMPDTV